MELTLISDSKLKVRLTRGELDGFSLTCETLDYDNTETKYALWSILKEAKSQTGFDTARERLYIKVYPQPDGGCDMLVAKIKNNIYNSAESSENALHKKAEKISSLLSSETISPVSSYAISEINPVRSIYSFDRISVLLEVCSKLCDIKFSGSSSVYHESSGIYYLLLSCNDSSDRALALINEYCDKCITEANSSAVKYNETYSYIDEHCAPVCCNDAIQKLSEFFVVH